MFIYLGQNNFLPEEMPIHTNWATHSDYRKIGIWIKRNYPNSPIKVYREIGTLAFYCDCNLVNPYSSQGWMNDYLSIFILNKPFINKKQPLSFNYELMIEPENTGSEGNYEKKWTTNTRWINNTRITFSKFDY